MRVLVAEDDPFILNLLLFWLKQWNFEPVVAKTGLEAWSMLQFPDAPKLVLMDWMMPGLEGPQVLRLLRSKPPSAYSYVIMLTGSSDNGDVGRAFAAGADDYMVKPFNPEELHARLRVGKRIVDLNSQLLSAQEALRFEARHDHLTGLMNRAAVFEALHREFERASRQDAYVSVILADLDHFKKINDTYGHIAGDLVLRAAAETIKNTTRVYDSPGRYGGEEFIIVVPFCNLEGARIEAERIREALANTRVTIPQGELTVTTS